MNITATLREVKDAHGEVISYDCDIHTAALFGLFRKKRTATLDCNRMWIWTDTGDYLFNRYERACQSALRLHHAMKNRAPMQAPSVTVSIEHTKGLT